MTVIGPNSTVTQDPKIAAGCVFSDAWDILPITISNLIAQGVTDFYLMDHLSENDFGANLQRDFSNLAEIRVCRKTTAPFHQGRMTTALAKAAQDDGFDVFIPFDSDEFWGTAHPDVRVADRLAAWWSESRADTVYVPELDFIQQRTVEEFTSSTLASARFRVLERGDPTRARLLIEAGAPYFVRAPSSKVAVRLTARNGAPSKVWLAEGNHESLVPDRDVVHLTELVVRHLPFRSQRATDRRTLHGGRIRAAGFSENIGWHVHMIAALNKEALDEFWRSNSWMDGIHGPQLGGLHGSSVELTEDGALAQVLHTCMEMRLPLELNPAPDRPGQGEAPTERSVDFASHLMSIILDSPPKPSEIAERDAALAERDAVLNSRLWRATTWYRRMRAGNLR